MTARLLNPRGAAVRLAAGVVSGVGAGLVTPDSWGVIVRAVFGWSVGATVLGALMWIIIGGSNSEQSRVRAAGADPGRTAVWGLVLVASLFSLLACTALLGHGRAAAGEHADRFVALCIWAVGVAWGLTHSAFALRYAHLFYRTQDGEGGLAFPGNEPPDDLDFAYVAFTVGMCFQLSDVSVTSRTIRRTVLVHSLLSFVYNTAIIALVLNLVVGRLT